MCSTFARQEFLRAIEGLKRRRGKLGRETWGPYYLLLVLLWVKEFILNDLVGLSYMGKLTEGVYEKLDIDPTPWLILSFYSVIIDVFFRQPSADGTLD